MRVAGEVWSGGAKTILFFNKSKDLGGCISLLGDPFWGPFQGSAVAPKMGPRMTAEEDPQRYPNLVENVIASIPKTDPVG